jgi:hypothetical protein
VDRGFLRRHGDRLLALTLFAGVAIQAWVAFGVEGDDPIGPRDVLALVLSLLLAASLAWRRRASLAVLGLAIAAAAVSVDAPVDAPVAFVVALTVATYSVGANTTGRAAVLGGVGVGVLMSWRSPRTRTRPGHHVAVPNHLGPAAGVSLLTS